MEIGECMNLTIEDFQVLFSIMSNTIVYVPVPGEDYNMTFRAIDVISVDNVEFTSTGSRVCSICWRSRYDEDPLTEVECRIDDSTKVIWCELSYDDTVMIVFEISNDEFIKWKLLYA